MTSKRGSFMAAETELAKTPFLLQTKFALIKWVENLPEIWALPVPERSEQKKEIFLGS
jgi:hypothetical protein